MYFSNVFSSFLKRLLVLFVCLIKKNTINYMNWRWISKICCQVIYFLKFIIHGIRSIDTNTITKTCIWIDGKAQRVIRESIKLFDHTTFWNYTKVYIFYNCTLRLNNFYGLKYKECLIDIIWYLRTRFKVFKQVFLIIPRSVTIFCLNFFSGIFFKK